MPFIDILLTELIRINSFEINVTLDIFKNYIFFEKINSGNHTTLHQESFLRDLYSKTSNEKRAIQLIASTLGLDVEVIIGNEIFRSDSYDCPKFVVKINKNVSSSGGILRISQRQAIKDFSMAAQINEVCIKDMLISDFGLIYNQKILNYACNSKGIITQDLDIRHLMDNVTSDIVSLSTLKVLSKASSIVFQLFIGPRFLHIGDNGPKILLVWRKNGINILSDDYKNKLNLTYIKNIMCKDFPLSANPILIEQKWTPHSEQRTNWIHYNKYQVSKPDNLSDIFNWITKELLIQISEDDIYNLGLVDNRDTPRKKIHKLLSELSLTSMTITYREVHFSRKVEFKVDRYNVNNLFESSIKIARKEYNGDLYLIDDRDKYNNKLILSVKGVGYSDICGLLQNELISNINLLQDQSFLETCKIVSGLNLSDQRTNNILSILISSNVVLNVYKPDNPSNFKEGNTTSFTFIFSLNTGAANRINICCWNSKYYTLSSETTRIQSFNMELKNLISTKKQYEIDKYVQPECNINKYLEIPDNKFIMKSPSTYRAEVNVYSEDISINAIDEIFYTFEGSYWCDNIKKQINHTCEYKNLIKLQHDWAVSDLMDSTDVSLKSVGLSKGDDGDNKTPDYIYRQVDGNISKYHVLEIGTVINPNNAASEYEIKKASYQSILQSRTSDSIYVQFSIIIITPTSVLTNLLLPNETKKSLIEKYLIGKYMKSLAINNNIINEVSENLSIRMRHIEGLYKSIPDFEGDNLLPKDVVENILKPYTIDDTIKSEKMLNEIWDKQFVNNCNNFIKGMETGDPIINNYNSLLLDHKEKEKIQEEISTRIDLKAVCQLPFLIPKFESAFDLSLNLPVLLSDETPESRLWKEAISNYEETHMDPNILNDFERICLPIDEQFEYNESQEVKNSRRFRGSTKPYISESDEIHFAKLGVNGKEFSKLEEVKTYRSMKKETFRLKTNTLDIENYIKDLSLYEYSQTDQRNESILDNLILDALNIHKASQSSNQHIRLVKNLLSTKLGKFCTLVSDIGQEIAMSINQNCSKNEFRIKKLPRFKDVYLLVKPTSKTKKIFYSILFKDDDYTYSTVFKKSITCGNGWSCTEFVSDSISKLVNKTRCESIFISIFISMCELYQVDSYNQVEIDKLIQQNPSIAKMTNLAILVSLEDKHATEEAITLHRYIHMESMVELPCFPNPSKMFEKLNLNIKSRLELYIYKRSKLLIKTYSENPCYSSGIERREWNKFYNPFILLETGILEMVNHDNWLNLCYLGYLKNKDEVPEENVSGKLISKIVEREDELPLNVDGSIDFSELGIDEPKAFGGHKFSPSFIRHICNEAKESIKQKYGCKNYDEYMTTCILKKFSGELINTLATLKASSVYNPDLYHYDTANEKKKKNKEKIKSAKKVFNINRKDKLKEFLEDRDDEESKELLDILVEEKEVEDKEDFSYHRIRMIEFIINRLKEYPENHDCSSISSLMPKSLENLEKDNCLHIDIFKKNQHAGLREIYVLTGDGRIVQKCIEDIARAILSHFEGETMTHPKSKYLLPEKANSHCSETYGSHFRLCTSDDAAKWNQYHTVSKFIIMLTQLTPKLFHPFIIRTLRLWFDKKIKIGDDLLKLFNFCQINTRDKWVQAAYDAYNGKRNDIVWMEKGMSHIRTKSGMMQGILHYTSSLLHVCYLNSLEKFLYKKIQDVMRYYIGIKSPISLVHIMYLVSSDDSLLNIYFPSCDIEGFNKYLILCKLISLTSFDLKTIAGTHLAIHKSIKSTTLTMNMHEFNSEFYFERSQRKPTLRWVNASLMISEQSNLLGRQEEMSNTLTSILEGGGTIHQTSICQISQALLFYRIMGSGVSELWSLYEVFIKYDKDPTSGYFLMDSPILAGLAGLKYNMWLLSRTTRYNYKLDYLLNKTKDKMGLIREDESINKSDILRGLTFCYSGGFKYQSLLNSVGYDPSFLDSISEDPSILFRPSNTPSELLMECYIKLRSPGVRESLSSNNILAREMASSVYILTRPVLYTHSEIIKEIAGNLQTNKISLLSYLIGSNLNMHKNSIKPYNKTWITDELKNLTSNDVFDAVVEVLQLANRIDNRVDLVINYIKKVNRGLLDPIDKIRLLSSFIGEDVLITEQHDMHPNAILINTLEYINCNDKSYPITIIKMLDNSLKYIVDKHIDLFNLSSYRTCGLKLDTELFLFPMMPEYEKLSNDAFGFDVKGILSSSRNTRDKTRLNYEVISKDTMSSTQMVTILKYIWFGYTTKMVSSNVLEVAFEDLKKTFSWLRDTISETLKESPFDTYLQLFWFISKNPYKSRVIHMNGAYMNIDNVKLRTLVSLNFSDAMKAVDISRIQNLEHKPVKELLHILSGLNSLPFSDGYKLLKMVDIIYKSPDIITNYSERDKNVARLSILQKFVKLHPGLNIENYTGFSDNTLRKMISDRQSLNLHQAEIIYNDVYRNIKDKSQEEIEEYIEKESRYNALCAEDILNGELKEETINSIVRNSEFVDKELVDFAKKHNNKCTFFHIMHGDIQQEAEIQNKDEQFFNTYTQLIQSLKDNNLGVFGYYTKTQKYNPINHLYYGEGIWQGVMGHTRVKIYVDSDANSSYLKAICVDNMNHLNDLLYNLKRWSDDNNLELKDNPEMLNTRLDITGKIKSWELARIKDTGLPIYLDREMPDVTISAIYNIRLELSHTGLRLVAKDRDLTRDITLLSIPLSLRYFQRNINIDTTTNKSYNLLEKTIRNYIQHEIRPENTNLILWFCENRSEESRVNEETLHRWVFDLFESVKLESPTIDIEINSINVKKSIEDAFSNGIQLDTKEVNEILLGAVETIMEYNIEDINELSEYEGVLHESEHNFKYTIKREDLRHSFGTELFNTLGFIRMNTIKQIIEAARSRDDDVILSAVDWPYMNLFSILFRYSPYRFSREEVNRLDLDFE